MEFIRWYSLPILIGFICSLFLNPLVAALGFVVWLVLVGYAVRRAVEGQEQ